MKQLKHHLKYKNKPLCNTHSKRRLQYAASRDDVTCGNCRHAMEK